MKSGICCLLVGVALARAAAAGTVRVPGDYPTIQAALDGASPGDDILVAAGTYTENLKFPARNLRLRSVAGAQTTIINGAHPGPVVTLNTQDSSSIIGFTIQNGNNIAGPNLEEGGGISVQSGSPVIEANIIQDNRAGYAGGGIGVGFSSPTIRNNIIRRNYGGSALGGGGISLRGSAPAVIVGNVIVDNQSGSFAGGISLWAAGTPQIRNNVIAGNRGSDAGGISMVNGGSPSIVQNLIVNNTGSVGGISGPLGSIVNNTIAGNSGISASGLGGYGGEGTRIVNNILSALPGETLLQCSGNALQFRNNILFASVGSIVSTGCTNPSGANGNLNTDLSSSAHPGRTSMSNRPLPLLTQERTEP